MHIFFLQFYQHEIKYFNPIQSNPTERKKYLKLTCITFWEWHHGVKVSLCDYPEDRSIYLPISLYIYTCHKSIFTVWCNYVALVSFYLYLFNLYIYLLIYLNIYLTWCYYYHYFLTLTLSRRIDWHELELVLCILCIYFFYNFTNMK